MIYKLVSADRDNIELLIEYKLNTIFEFAKKLPLDEINKINKYVNDKVNSDYLNYKVIMVDKKIIGCLLLEPYQDGLLINEIYIEDNYRNNGIGSNILNKLLLLNKKLYLYVYKDNKQAIKLYIKLGFKIDLETETRYFMSFNNVN